MPFDTLMLFAASYDDEATALKDYEAVKDLYKESGLIDTYDAAVVSRDDDGKVHIVKKHEQPTRQGGLGGLGIGLVGGALIAVFPAVAIGGALLVGGATGAGLGALAGHLAAGMSRSDLKELGEALDKGQSSLVVVAASDMEAHVDEALKANARLVKKQLRADEKDLEKAIDEAVAAS
jgi:uncharacterized membrane protein